MTKEEKYDMILIHKERVKKSKERFDEKAEADGGFFGSGKEVEAYVKELILLTGACRPICDLHLRFYRRADPDLGRAEGDI